MAEPNSVALKSAASGALTTTATGFDPVTMGIGFMAGLFALLVVTPQPGEKRTPLRIFGLVAGSAFLAGALVPVAVAGGINYAPWLVAVDAVSLQWAMAALLGATPHLAPMAWRLWKDRA